MNQAFDEEPIRYIRFSGTASGRLSVESTASSDSLGSIIANNLVLDYPQIVIPMDLTVTPAAVEVLNRMQGRSRKRGLDRITENDINAEIKAARKENDSSLGSP